MSARFEYFGETLLKTGIIKALFSAPWMLGTAHPPVKTSA
jgi:hypothetical protein